MHLSHLSNGLFRNATLALALVFAATAAVIPVEAEAAPRSASQKKKQKKPQASPKKRGGGYQGGPKAWIYINAETGAVLAQSDATKEIEPASLTKEMTAIVVFDALRQKKLRLGDMLPLAAAAQAAGQGAVTLQGKTGLRPGALLSVDTLLAATAVASAADATVTLARGVCGDEDCFTDLMNKKVRQILNVKDGERSSTYFSNSHGMPGNRTTAQDLAKIHLYMIKTYPKESRYFAMTSYKINGRDYPGHNRLLVEYECKNRLHMLYKCLEASKTGFFRAAGFGIVGSASWNGYRIIGVQMGHASSAQRNQALVNGLDLHFKNLEQSGAPKSSSARWHLPSLGDNPPVEPEPDPEHLPEEQQSRAPALSPPRGSIAPS